MPNVQNMTTQSPGRELIRSFEGKHLTAYLLQDEDAYTIGWGHKGSEIKKGMVWTEAQAEAMFKKDVIEHENRMKKDVKVPLNQNQFDALSSFAYNLGGLKLKNGEMSTLGKLLNQGKYNEASKHFIDFIFPLWARDGLIRRRTAERRLFNKSVGPVAPVKTADNEKAVNDANAKKLADAKKIKDISDKLHAQDVKDALADSAMKKKAELTKNKQSIANADATAKKNALARKVASDVAIAQAKKTKQMNDIASKNALKAKAPIKNNISAPRDAQQKNLPGKIEDLSKMKVLKSGFTVIGLISLIVLLNNAELPTTELE